MSDDPTHANDRLVRSGAERTRDGVERVAEWAWPGHPRTWRRLRERLWPVCVNYLRMAVAGVTAHVAGRLLLGGPLDLTTALTSLLVLQASASGSFKMGLIRVAAVLTGVGVALTFASWVGLTWWSLGLVIFVSLLFAKAFRLKDQELEVPISGMLILGAAAAAQPVAAESRVLATLIGTAIGIVVPLVWAPAVPVPSAAAAIKRLAVDLAAVLRQASVRFDEQPITRESVDEQIEANRALSGATSRAEDQVRKVEDLWRWNSRTIGRADVTPLLTSGLESIHDAVTASRVLFTVLRDAAPQTGDPRGDLTDDHVRAVLAVVLADIAACIESFGSLVEAEVRGHEDELLGRIQENLQLLDETRAMLTSLMLVDPSQTSTWMLHGSVLRALDEILRNVDPEARATTRTHWREAQAGRPLPSLATASELPVIDRATLAAWQQIALQPWRQPSTRPAPRAGTTPEAGGSPTDQLDI